MRVLETNPHARLLGIRRLGIPKILKRLEEKKKPHVSMSSVSGIRLDYRCAHLPVSTRRGRGVDPSLRDLSGPARATPAMRSGRVGCGASWTRPSPTPAFRVPLPPRWQRPGGSPRGYRCRIQLFFLDFSSLRGGWGEGDYFQ